MRNLDNKLRKKCYSKKKNPFHTKWQMKEEETKKA